MLNERNDGYQKLIDYQNLFFILNMFTKKAQVSLRPITLYNHWGQLLYPSPPRMYPHA